MRHSLDTFRNRILRSVAEKVADGVPISDADALSMLTTHDILELGSIAHYMKIKFHGRKVFYGINMNLNYTNICELRCPICAFSRNREDEDAYALSIEEIEERVREATARRIDEVHIVGGLNGALGMEYYEEILRTIKRIKPDMFIVAYTATEFDYFSRISGLPLKEVLRRMIDAGLGALPGGGAEIFAPDVRNIITPKKISGDRWLEVMRTAHSLGLKTNATMLYNHRETPEDIVNHLSRIRALQEETDGFKTFVPLLYHDANTGIRARRRTTSGYDDIRLYATCRIFLHNIPHVKGLWMYLGEKMAQVLLNFGVDDIGSTYYNEKIVHAAGADTPDSGTEPYLRNLIEKANMIPVRTTSDYRETGTVQ